MVANCWVKSETAVGHAGRRPNIPHAAGVNMDPHVKGKEREQKRKTIKGMYVLYSL
jgi:hypothetical protein